MNIVVCEDPDKEKVMEQIKSKGLCTKYIGGVDDYEIYPNGYYATLRGKDAK